MVDLVGMSRNWICVIYNYPHFSQSFNIFFPFISFSSSRTFSPFSPVFLLLSSFFNFSFLILHIVVAALHSFRWVPCVFPQFDWMQLYARMCKSNVTMRSIHKHKAPKNFTSGLKSRKWARVDLLFQFTIGKNPKPIVKWTWSHQNSWYGTSSINSPTIILWRRTQTACWIIMDENKIWHSHSRVS